MDVPEMQILTKSMLPGVETRGDALVATGAELKKTWGIYILYLVVSNDTRKILKRGSEQRNIYVIYCSFFTFKGNHPRTPVVYRVVDPGGSVTPSLQCGWGEA